MEKIHIIFDLDGTLIDPADAICNSINYALKKLGHKEVDHKDLYPYIGKHLMEPFQEVTGVSDNEYLWKLINAYRENYETNAIAENRLYPGIKDMILGLKAPKYIASIKPAHASSLILDEFGISEHFSGVYGSELDGTRADKTELLVYLKEQESINNAIMIGDRDTDVFAAKECGFGSIGVTYGYGSSEELKESGPDLIVERPEDLYEAIKRLV